MLDWGVKGISLFSGHLHTWGPTSMFKWQGILWTICYRLKMSPFSYHFQNKINSLSLILQIVSRIISPQWLNVACSPTMASTTIIGALVPISPNSSTSPSWVFLCILLHIITHNYLNTWHWFRECCIMHHIPAKKVSQCVFILIFGKCPWNSTWTSQSWMWSSSKPYHRLNILRLATYTWWASGASIPHLAITFSHLLLKFAYT